MTRQTVDSSSGGSGTPAALITAPGSGHGKSIVTAALARLHRNAGRHVRVFKHGPDYLDPMLLERASGQPVYQLHPWMTGAAECRARLAEASTVADIILVEGSMGLFDGGASSAELARLTGLPALPVIDAAGMAQTFGAVVAGLSCFRADVAVHEVIANRVGSARHREMIGAALPDGVRLLGAIPRAEALAIPDRHLGIVQAEELSGLDAQLDAAAGVLAEAGLDQPPAPVRLEAERQEAPPSLLTGWRIGIARDRAFAFLYRANLELLEAMGAKLVYFSPLADAQLPAVDALWLPGGYPELHAAALAANTALRRAIRSHLEAGRPILAECGGLMYCTEAIVDGDGTAHAALGLLPGRAVMAGRLTGLGMQSLATTMGELRGHAFHHSRLEHAPEATAQTTPQEGGRRREAVFQHHALTATYFHAYFPSNPAAAAALFTGEMRLGP